MIYVKTSIYQTPTHPWKHCGMPEPSVYKNSHLSIFTPRACVMGNVIGRVVVIVVMSTKIAISRDVGI